MGVDDDQDCVEHAWTITELHVSMDVGVEQVKHCTRPGCDAVVYLPDPGRAPGRPRL